MEKRQNIETKSSFTPLISGTTKSWLLGKMLYVYCVQIFFICLFFCVCLPRKFMGLKAKVCFTGDMGLGFG